MIIFGARGHYQGLGGVENSIRALSDTAIAQGFPVTLVCRKAMPGEQLKDSWQPQSSVECSQYLDEKTVNWMFQPWNILRGGRNLFRLYEDLIEKYPQAIVIARHHFHVLAANSAGFTNIRYLVPSVISNQFSVEIDRLDSLARCAAQLQVSVNSLMQARAFEKSQLFVFSELMRNQVAKVIGRSDNVQKVNIVKPGIDWTRFYKIDVIRQTQLRRHLRLPTDKKIFLFVGRFVHAKGLDILIEASEHLPRDHLLILVGDGPLKQYLNIKINQRSLGERIMVLDPLYRVEDYYQACDVFVMPSLYEPLGQVILEAIASGMRVVAFHKNAQVDTATHELGLDMVIDYAMEKTASALASAMLISGSQRPSHGGDDILRGQLRSFKWEVLLGDLLE